MIIEKTAEIEMMCVCGDSENEHVDNCEQCFIAGCGCSEFEEEETEESIACSEGICDGSGIIPEQEDPYTGAYQKERECVCKF